MLLQNDLQMLGAGAGDARIAVGNIQGDAVPEIIMAPGRRTGTQINVYTIYEKSKGNDYSNDFYGLNPVPLKVITTVPGAVDPRPGINLAAADMTGDGYDEIVSGSEISPNIKVIDPTKGYSLWAEITLNKRPNDIRNAYANGVRVAARPGQVIAASGRGGAEVRIYSIDRIKYPDPLLPPILQTFYPSKINRFGTANPVKGLFAG